jgi:ABC-type lipoprotein release transport system permease subunit
VPYRLAEGRALPPGALGALLLGGQLATRLAVAPGARVDLRVILELGRAGGQERLPLSASASPASPAPPGPRALGAYAMEVAGIVRGAFTADEAVVVDRGFLSAELGEPDAATLLVVRSDAPFEAEALARRIEVALPEVEARAWAADSAFLGSAIQGNRALNAISSAMAMVGVAIPVWALLYVAVTRRRREIGLYGALGFSAREVFALFLMHALVVGLAGVALGAAAGVGLVRWFSAHPIFADASFAIRPALAPAALLRSSAIILGTTVAAGVVPALRAARVDPARVLRGLP